MHTMSLAFLVLLSFTAALSAPMSVAQYVNDNNVLNYALTLENLEAAYYAAGLSLFGTTDTNYTAAGYPKGTAAAIQLIASQEAGHAAALAATLAARGYPAVPACVYNFSSALTSVTTYINTLAVVENLGTSAYLGAASGLTSGDLLTIAAGIATVEARHTAILNTLTNTSYAAPFPNVQDIALSPSDVLTAVTNTKFIVSCPSASSTTVAYGNPSVTVSSGTPSSFAFQNSADVRGDSTVVNNPSAYYANTAAGQAAAANDFAVLNYALTLEYLEAFFYQNFTGAFSVAAIQAANANANATIVQQSIDLIRTHEAAHVNYLKNILGASATNPCNYTFNALGLAFGSTDFSKFISAAAALENKGVNAYVGAIRLIINPFVAALAGAIGTVEARHAAYIADVANSLGSIYGNNGNVKFDASPINTVIFNDVPNTPNDVVNFLVTNNVLFNCPASNPSNIYGVPGGRTNTAQNFFGDNVGAPSSTTQTGTQSTSSTPTGTATTSSTFTPARTTGSASTLSVAFGVLALVAALF